MEVTAKAKYIRMSPRKVRAVADVIRGLNLSEAFDQLQFTQKHAVKPITKLLKSAMANADHNLEIKEDNLYIKAITVGEGPTLKRWKPRARGRATPIRKRTSHIELILAEIKEGEGKSKKKQKLEAPTRLEYKPKKDDGVKVDSKDKKKAEEKLKDEKDDEKGKKIIDPRSEGRGKHARIEGKGQKGFVNKIFRRKSG
jgi:large subunit ribosomal protein L22